MTQHIDYEGLQRTASEVQGFISKFKDELFSTLPQSFLNINADTEIGKLVMDKCPNPICAKFVRYIDDYEPSDDLSLYFLYFSNSKGDTALLLYGYDGFDPEECDDDDLKEITSRLLEKVNHTIVTKDGKMVNAFGKTLYEEGISVCLSIAGKILEPECKIVKHLGTMLNFVSPY